MDVLTNASQAIRNGYGNIHMATRQQKDDVVITI